MSSPQSDVSSARRALRLGGLLLTLAGLFGMHGLASHGTAQMDAKHSGYPAIAAQSTAPSMHSSTAGALEAAVTGSASAHAEHATTAAMVRVSAAAALSDPADGMGMNMCGAAMCLAVLLLTALALLVGASLRGANALRLRTQHL